MCVHTLYIYIYAAKESSNSYAIKKKDRPVGCGIYWCF